MRQDNDLLRRCKRSGLIRDLLMIAAFPAALVLVDFVARWAQ